MNPRDAHRVLNKGELLCDKLATVVGRTKSTTLGDHRLSSEIGINFQGEVSLVLEMNSIPTQCNI